MTTQSILPFPTNLGPAGASRRGATPDVFARQLADVVALKQKAIASSADDRGAESFTVLVLALSGSADVRRRPDLAWAEVLASYEFTARDQRGQAPRPALSSAAAEPVRSAGTLSVGRIRMDLDGMRVHLGPREIELTHQEFSLLRTFMEHPNRVLSRGQLLSHAWPYSDNGGGRTVDVHVRRLRVKLESEAGQLVTVRGFGYRLESGARSGGGDAQLHAVSQFVSTADGD